VKESVVYLLFVGIPLLGLLFVLQLGRRITPTISVGGHWTIDPQGQLAAALPCSGPAAPVQGLPIEIQQSGRHLSMVVGNGDAPPLRGRIASSGLVATAPSGGRVIRLSAEIDRSTKPETMVGALVLGECPSGGGADPPPQVPFRAHRDTSSRAKADP
jgi:hypothetical protein